MSRSLRALLLLPSALVAAEPAKLSDAQVEAMAREALVSASAKVQNDTLKVLRVHHFKSSLAKEREVALYAQGTLEDRLGESARAAATFHRLEQSWPQSGYLPEAQVVMAESALEHKRHKEAETRLRKALGAELPAESVRRAQELFLWCLADQGRASEGLATVDSLKPLGTSKPTEKGLVGILETLCAARRQAEAKSIHATYHQLYSTGKMLQRVDLDWAKLLGLEGDANGSAKVLQKLIQTAPASTEADEARLALATLLSDGRLTAKEGQAFPSPASLLADLDRASMKEGPARQATLVRLRVALKERRWREAIDNAGQARALHPGEPEQLQITELRAEAIRGWAQDLLGQHQPGPLLPFLDAEGIQALSPEQRLALAKRLAEMGLPEAARPLLATAPTRERPALRQAAVSATSASNPHGALALLGTATGSSHESLVRAQANAALGAWPETRTALARATPGPERIQVLLALLNRAPDGKDADAARLKEAEGWLARAPEKGPVREPLAILTADLRARRGDWRGALALYPASAQTGNRGWVALMRATCQARLGQTGPAKATLQQAGDDPQFRSERQALAQRLGL